MFCHIKNNWKQNNVFLFFFHAKIDIFFILLLNCFEKKCYFWWKHKLEVKKIVSKLFSIKIYLLYHTPNLNNTYIHHTLQTNIFIINIFCSTKGSFTNSLYLFDKWTNFKKNVKFLLIYTYNHSINIRKYYSFL